MRVWFGVLSCLFVEIGCLGGVWDCCAWCFLLIGGLLLLELCAFGFLMRFDLVLVCSASCFLLYLSVVSVLCLVDG